MSLQGFLTNVLKQTKNKQSYFLYSFLLKFYPLITGKEITFPV